MSGAENIDVDLYDTREKAVQAALDACCEDGDRIVICRGEWGSCPDGGTEACEFCARVAWSPGLSVSEVLLRASRN